MTQPEFLSDVDSIRTEIATDIATQRRIRMLSWAASALALAQKYAAVGLPHPRLELGEDTVPPQALA